MRGLLLLGLLAACGNDAGLLLDVHPGDKNVVRVDVLLPDDQPGHYMGLPPSPTGPKIAGPVYAVIDKAGGTVDANGDLRVLLTPGTQSDVPALLVLGYDASDTPIRYAVVSNPDGSAIDLPSSTSTHLIVNLDAIKTLPVAMAPAAAATDTVLARWSHTAVDDSSAECFAILSPSANGRTGIFFGPTDDLDCDAASPECDNTWYDKVGSGASTNPGPCVTERGSTDTMNACRIGTPVACTDNVGGCKPDDGPAICLPDAVCHDCGGGQDMFDGTCFDSAASDQQTLHVECSIPVRMDTGGTTYTLCNSVQTALGLDLASDIGTMFTTTGDDAFVDPDAMVGTNSLPLNGGSLALTFSVQQPQRGVSFDLESVDAGGIDPSLPPTPGVLAVDFVNTANVSRELVFPFVATYVPDCTHPATCRIVTGVKNGQTYTDTIWHCVGR